MLPFDENLNEAPHFSDNPQFEEWVDKIMNNLFEMNGHLSTLQQFIKTLQKNQSQGNTRSKMIANLDKKSVYHINAITELLKVINSLVHKINEIEETELDRAQLISRDKLTRDVKYAVQEFQEAQKEFTSTSKVMNAQAKQALAEDEETREDNVINSKSQEQITIEREAINNEEFAYQQRLIQERDEEIAHIESGIEELNDIFHDLGTIVQQQGYLVDNIESNIYTVANNTQSGARELTKAMRSQRSSSIWCIRMLIIVSVLLVMFLLVVFS